MKYTSPASTPSDVAFIENETLVEVNENRSHTMACSRVNTLFFGASDNSKETAQTVSGESGQPDTTSARRRCHCYRSRQHRRGRYPHGCLPPRQCRFSCTKTREKTNADKSTPHLFLIPFAPFASFWFRLYVAGPLGALRPVVPEVFLHGWSKAAETRQDHLFSYTTLECAG